jgi:uncharacterized membrane protein
MTINAVSPSSTSSRHTARIHTVPASAPFDWLAAGARCFLAAPVASLVYGALFTLFTGAALYLTWELPGFAVAILTGLLLVGPVLASGLYVAARQQEAGERVSIPAALSLLRSRATNLALFGVFLALIMAAWVRVSALLFALKFNSVTIPVEGYLGLLSGGGDPLALLYFLVIGFALAATVFVTSAVAIPMILDRDCGPIAAIQTSARAVVRNWPAMALWAAAIVILAGIGMLSLLAGMLVLFPILGYATWHSYRSMIG